MIKSLFFLFLISSNAFSTPIDISSKQNQLINPTDLNTNVNYINTILSDYSYYSYNINWINKISTDFIKKEEFENLFKSLDQFHILNYNTILNNAIKATEIQNGFNHLETIALDMIPQSCLEILERDPSKFEQDGTYLIDTDGFNGPNSPYLVYCDMTTEGGGWTNIGNTMGNYTNQLNVKLMENKSGGGYQIHSNRNLSDMGLTNTTSDNFINGSLKGRASNNSCTTRFFSLFLDDTLLSRYNATKVKLEAKSYAGSTLECGGILNSLSNSYTDLTKYNNFNTKQLSTCGSYPSASYHNYTNSNYLHFSFIPTGNNIANLVARCRDGNAYIQIKSIMVK